jgi:hypothetical protein
MPPARDAALMRDGSELTRSLLNAAAGRRSPACLARRYAVPGGSGPVAPAASANRRPAFVSVAVRALAPRVDNARTNLDRD